MLLFKLCTLAFLVWLVLMYLFWWLRGDVFTKTERDIARIEQQLDREPCLDGVEQRIAEKLEMAREIGEAISIYEMEANEYDSYD